MKRWLVCLGLTFWATGAAAQNLVITNARILDGKGGAIERGSVVVRDGKIVSVAAGTAAAQGARVIDVKGMTVMPGFIDSHRHPIGQGADWLKTEAPARMQDTSTPGSPPSCRRATTSTPQFRCGIRSPKAPSRGRG